MASVTRSTSKRELGSSAKLYLFIYNMIQFVGWSYSLYLFLKYVSSRPNYDWKGVWPHISFSLTLFQTLQAIEVLHCALKLVPSSAIQTAMQIASRLILVWGILRPVPESRDSWGLPLLMTAWSLAESTRYLYYALNIYDCVPYFLTWARYTFFIVLYPVGVTGELLAIISSLGYIRDRSLFSWPLPNFANFSFHYYLALYAIMASYIPCE